MRALIQRVRSAEVEADDEVLGRIDRGLLVYLGVGIGDDATGAARLAKKVAGLRIFEDGQGKLNLSVQDVGGDVLVIPNFTLMADAHRGGRRPSFTTAANGKLAEPLYQAFAASLAECGCRVERGAFGKHMEIFSVADGPVNLVTEFPPPDLASDRQAIPKAKS